MDSRLPAWAACIAAMVVGAVALFGDAATAQQPSFAVEIEDLELDDPSGQQQIVVRLVPEADDVGSVTVKVIVPEPALVQAVAAEVIDDQGLCALVDGVVGFAGFNLDPNGWNQPTDLCVITYQGLGSPGVAMFEVDVSSAVSTEFRDGFPVEIAGVVRGAAIRVGATEPTATPTSSGPGTVIDAAPTATAEPSPTPEPTATAEPTTEPTTAPEPTPEPTTEPTAAAEPTPEPIDAATAGPTTDDRGTRALPEPTPTPEPAPRTDERVEASEPADDQTVGSAEDDPNDAEPAIDDGPGVRIGISTDDDRMPSGLLGAVAAGFFAVGGGLAFANRRQSAA